MTNLIRVFEPAFGLDDACLDFLIGRLELSVFIFFRMIEDVLAEHDKALEIERSHQPPASGVRRIWGLASMHALVTASLLCRTIPGSTRRLKYCRSSLSLAHLSSSLWLGSTSGRVSRARAAAARSFESGIRGAGTGDAGDEGSMEARLE